jgi:hypothetical protein
MAGVVVSITYDPYESYSLEVATALGAAIGANFACVPKIERLRTIKGDLTDWYHVRGIPKRLHRDVGIFIAGWEAGSHSETRR